MSTTAVMGAIPEARPQPMGRMTGIVYLLYFVTAISAQLMLGHKLVALGNATNILGVGFYLLLTLLFYSLFKPVSRGLSVLAALFGIAGCGVMAVGFLYPAAPSISPLWCFGPYCLLIGYLVFRSTFLPHILGGMMVLAGVGWLAYLSPAVMQHLAMYIEGLGILAEASLMLWLIVMGVNVQRWCEEATAARRGR
jgi:hypothetical protein